MRILPSTFVAEREIRDTVLDPVGGEIEFPSPLLSWQERRKIKAKMVDPREHDTNCESVKVPYMAPYQVALGVWVLDPVSYRANNLLKAVKTKDPVVMQRSLDKYYHEIMGRLCGKDGLMARYLMSVRCENSARFVVVPGDADIGPHDIGIPEELAVQAGVEERDIVILSRSPILWQGSVVLMRARLVPGRAGRLNPMCLRGLGADFDGDTVSVIKWPFDVDDREAEKMLGPYVAGMPTAIALGAGPWSIGPEDLTRPAQSKFLMAFRDVRPMPSDVSEYALGLNQDEFAQKTEEIVLDVGRMKMQLGLVGSITDKICALVSDAVLPYALHAKERLTQALLDAKHGQKEGFDIMELSEAFETAGDAAETCNRIAHALEKGGVQKAAEIVSSLHGKGVPPLTRAFRERCPKLAVVKSSSPIDEVFKVLEATNGQ